MTRDEKELARFITDPIYRNRIIQNLKNEAEKEKNLKIRKLTNEKQTLIKQRNAEIQKINNLRWTKIGELSVNKTEGKIKINNKEYYFNSIKGAEINALYGSQIISKTREKTTSKKHISVGGALVGGSIGDAPGALIGGVGLGKTTSKTKGTTSSIQIPICNHLGVMIDIDGFPTELIISQYPVKQNDISYKVIMDKAEATINVLRELSKLPVPKTFNKVEDEYTVKIFDEAIENKAKEIDEVQNSDIMVKIPSKYRTIEQSDMSDDDYLDYLNNNANHGIYTEEMQVDNGSTFKQSFSGVYNVIFWILSLFVIMLLWASLDSKLWLKAFVATIIFLVTNPYCRIKIIEKNIKPIPHWIPIIVFIIGFIVCAAIPNGNYEDTNISVKNDVNETRSDKIESNEEIQVESSNSETEFDKSNDEKIVDAGGSKEASVSESDYKTKCQSVAYEDLYDNRTTLISAGSFITFNGMVKDVRVYNDMDIVSNSIYDGKYEFDDKFWLMGPEHKDLKGYVGVDVKVYFEKDSEILSENEIHTGDLVKIYGEIIDANKNGYTVLCSYIE